MLIFENEKEVYNECYTVDSNPILYFEPKFEIKLRDLSV